MGRRKDSKEGRRKGWCDLRIKRRISTGRRNEKEDAGRPLDKKSKENVRLDGANDKKSKGTTMVCGRIEEERWFRRDQMYTLMWVVKREHE